MDKVQFEILCEICERPVCYTGGSSLREVCAYMAGMDLMTGCLTGFREWMVTQLEDGTPEHYWQSHVRESALENQIADEDAVAYLGSLIRQFHKFMNPTAQESSHHGLMRVYLNYHEWCVTRGYDQPFKA